VTGPAVVGAVGRDGSHDAAAEDEAQQAHGDQLGRTVPGETPRAARPGGYGDRCRRWCGCWRWFCCCRRLLVRGGLTGGRGCRCRRLFRCGLLTRRGRCVGGQRGRRLVRCRPGCPRIVLRRLLRRRRRSLLAHVYNDAPFG
jgi:hypothetical protein